MEEFTGKRKAKLTLSFDDGTTKEIIIDRVLQFDVPGASIGFNQQPKDGTWYMHFKTGLFEGKKLADDFLTVSKI